MVRAALDAICKDFAADTTLTEPSRDIKVDSDTQGVAGQPPIAETILKKIDDAAVVVVDMTFTGTRRDGRPTPNPNVLIEYGWALKTHGYNRVIAVMNTAYGPPNRETLPFDLAHLRWPLTYTLPEDASDEARAEQKRELTRILKMAVLASLATIPAPALPVTPAFEEAQAKDGPGRFRSQGETLGFDDDSISGGNRDVFLADGPAMWLRLMPTYAQKKRWSTTELLRAGQEHSRLYPLRSGAGNYSYVRAKDGQGIYRMPPTGDSAEHIVAYTIGFAFRTGEVWSIDTTLLAFDKDSINYGAIEETFTSAAERYRQFLRALSIPSPYRWRAGLIGVRGRLLRVPQRTPYDFLDNPACAADEIEMTGDLDDHQTTKTALLPFFRAIFEECGVEPSRFLPAE